MTLIELIVVISVVGVLLAIGFSMMESLLFGNSSAKEANMLIQAFTFCRQKAIISQRVVFLELNLLERSYRAFQKVEAEIDMSVEEEEDEEIEEELENMPIGTKDDESADSEEEDSESKALTPEEIEEENKKLIRNIEIVLQPYEYSEDYGIVDIMDVYGGSYTDLETYIIGFYPNGLSQSLLIHLGNKEVINRTIHINKYTGDIKNMPGDVRVMAGTLGDDEKEEMEVEGFGSDDEESI
jgi:prepilin-type N-terminal cleavage/methylation domain-containing protein